MQCIVRILIYVASFAAVSRGFILTRTMETCSQCGREVPESNLILHEARCKGGEARKTSAQQLQQPAEPSEANKKGGMQEVITLLDSDDEDDESEVDFVSTKMPAKQPAHILKGAEVESMSIKELKAELISYGLSTESYFDKDSLVEGVEKARREGWRQPVTVYNGGNAGLSLEKGSTDTTFVPFHLFATSSSNSLRGNDAAKKYFRTLRQLVGFESGKRRKYQWLFIFNFLIDFQYLLAELPEVLRFHRVVVFYGQGPDANDMAAMNQWKQMLAGSGNTVEFILLKPSDPAGSRTNPLQIEIPYGCHHTKAFLVGYEENNKSMCRVVISSANLVNDDSTNGAYVQDFPLKQQNGDNKPASVKNPYKRKRDDAPDTGVSGCFDDEDDVPFEEDLITYLESYQYRTRQSWCCSTLSASSNSLSSRPMSWLQLIRQYDYSDAYVVLIPSVPGRHKSDSYHEYGYLKLRNAVRDWVCPHRSSSESSPPPILCQCSSIGALNEKWLHEFLSSIDYSTAESFDPITGSKNTKKEKDKRPPLSSRMKFVWPTMDEIRKTRHGWPGGGAVPGMIKNLDNKPFLQPLFHKWSSRRDPLRTARHIPHIKTFVQPFSSNGSAIDWLVLTSHNLSIAAWGQVQIRSAQSPSNEKILFIRHWELGVFISPSTLGKKMGNDVCMAAYPDTSAGGSTGVISIDCEDDEDKSETPKVLVPLPQGIDPDAYDHNDVAWARDRGSNLPDTHGGTIPQGLMRGYHRSY